MEDEKDQSTGGMEGEVRTKGKIGWMDGWMDGKKMGRKGSRAADL